MKMSVFKKIDLNFSDHLWKTFFSAKVRLKIDCSERPILAQFRRFSPTNAHEKTTKFLEVLYFVLFCYIIALFNISSDFLFWQKYGQKLFS